MLQEVRTNSRMFEETRGYCGLGGTGVACPIGLEA